MCHLNCKCCWTVNVVEIIGFGGGRLIICKTLTINYHQLSSSSSYVMLTFKLLFSYVAFTFLIPIYNGVAIVGKNTEQGIHQTTFTLQWLSSHCGAPVSESSDRHAKVENVSNQTLKSHTMRKRMQSRQLEEISVLQMMTLPLQTREDRV